MSKVYTNYLRPRINTIANTLGEFPAPVPNPIPAINALGQTFAIVGTGDQIFEVQGTGFSGSSTVLVDNVPVPTDFNSSTSLIATMPAAVVAVYGTKLVKVTNPAPGGGTSSSKPFSVQYTAPFLLAISPATGTLGNAPESRTVTGTDFYNGASIVNVDGVPASTAYVDFNTLTALIPAAAAGTKAITVVTTGVGGGTTSSVPYVVQYATPTFTGLSPSTGLQYAADLVVTLNGTGFYANSVVDIAGTPLAMTYVSPTQITATIPAAMMTSVASLALRVTNPLVAGGGGGSSGTQGFSVTFAYPRPTVTSLPVSTGALFSGGRTNFLVNGTGFAVGATTCEVDGVVMPCTVVSSTQLSVTLPNTLHWPSATWTTTRTFRVRNIGPGGGLSTTSAAYTLTIPTYVRCWYHPSQFVVAAGKVTSWLDVSGNGYHLTSASTKQGDYIASDTNGRPSVLLDGVNHFLQSPTIAAVAQQFNVFLDMAIVTQVGGKYIFSTDSTPKIYINSSPAPLGFTSGSGFPSGALTYPGDFASFDTQFSNTTSRQIVNARMTNVGVQTSGSDGFTRFQLGASNTSGQNCGNVKFQEAMITQGAIPANDVVEMNAYRDVVNRGWSGSFVKNVNGVTLGDSITFGQSQYYPPAQILTMLCLANAGVWINRGHSGASSADQDTNFANTGSADCLTDVLSTSLVNVVVYNIGINDTNLGRNAAQIYASVVSIAQKFYAWCHTNQVASLSSQARFVIMVFCAGDRGVADSAPVTAAKEAVRQAYKGLIVADTTQVTAGGVTRPLFSAKVLPIAELDDVTTLGTTSLVNFSSPSDLIHLNSLGALKHWRNAAPPINSILAAVA